MPDLSVVITCLRRAGSARLTPDRVAILYKRDRAGDQTDSYDSGGVGGYAVSCSWSVAPSHAAHSVSGRGASKSCGTTKFGI